MAPSSAPSGSARRGCRARRRGRPGSLVAAATSSALLLLTASLLTGCGGPPGTGSDAPRPPGEPAREGDVATDPATTPPGPGLPPVPLRVGLEAKYPPFESRTAAGALEGLDVDLAEAIGAHFGRPVTFSDMEFDLLIPELQAGRVDLVCSAVSRTPGRAEVVDFSEPYARVPMGVLVSTKLVPEGRGLDALEADGVSIAVQRGTSGELKAGERFPRARLVQFATEVDAATEVSLGRAHAFVYDVVSVVHLHERHPGATRILDLDLGVEEYAIALPKGSRLRAPIDAFLAEGRKPGGTVDAIYARWRAELDRLHVRTE